MNAANRILFPSLLLSAVWAWAQTAGGKIAIESVKLEAPATFSQHVYPILAEKCLHCHDRGGGLAEGNLDLTVAANVIKGGKRGPSVVAGQPGQSRLLQCAARAAEPFMPPKNETPLTPRELGIIERWILDGLKPGANLTPHAAPPTVKLRPITSAQHPVFALDFSAAGSRIAFVRGSAILIYDFPSGKPEASLSSLSDWGQALRFSPDGKLLAVGDYQQILLFARNENDGNWGETGRIGGFKDRVLTLDFRPDGQQLAVGSGRPASAGELAIVDVPNRKIRRTIDNAHSDVIYGVAYAPDGKKLASASADRFVKLHDPETGMLIKAFEGHTHYVLDVCWIKEGKQLVSASADGTLKVWDEATGEKVKDIPGHNDQVTSVAASGGADKFVSACADKQVRLVQADGKIERTYSGAADFIHCVGVTVDGKHVAAGDQAGVVRVWDQQAKLVLTLPSK